MCKDGPWCNVKACSGHRRAGLQLPRREEARPAHQDPPAAPLPLHWRLSLGEKMCRLFLIKGSPHQSLWLACSPSSGLSEHRGNPG